MTDRSIHPRAVSWQRDGDTGYSSSVGVVWRGPDNRWYAQPGSNMLEEDFSNWRAAARACEEWHGRRSKATERLR